MLQGDISLLYKKNERDEVRNYRPLTMLQTAYKIYTRVLAHRMRKVVHQVVDESQKGFMPDAFIADCSMLQNLIEAHINEDTAEERHGIMLFLDMEKAFDRCSWEFMLTGMKRMGFGPNFVQMIEMIYDEGNPPERRIFANGYYSEWFEINSGVAQGCPVSPLLFLIIAQGLAVAIKDAEIEGIKIKAVEIILAQFADDTTVFLRNWAELRRVSKPIQKWCGATAMRENITKREALAMGSYRKRTVPQDLRNIAWAKEGEWIRSLGVPIGNELDHALFWKKKIQATRDKANRWAGLCRSSYFGRNLIVQAMYFGRLRYWLFSVFMDKSTMCTIQEDADRLWWSRDPVLDGHHKRIRRFVARNTAIGPKKMGGLGNMSWKDHVTAYRAEWINRYIHPADAKWKEILDEMILKNKKGELKFGAGRGIFYCALTPAQKLRLLRNIPKKALYIRACIYAHWSLQITQDLTKTEGIRGEPMWESARFKTNCDWRSKTYFINVTRVTIMSDIINKDTDKPHTRDEWKAWIETLHNEKVGRDRRFKKLTNRELNAKATLIEQVVAQIPQQIIDEITLPLQYSPTPGDIVAMVHHEDGDEEHEVIYGVFTDTPAFGARVRTVVVDTVAKWHLTDVYKAAAGQYDIHETALWKGKRNNDWRIIGPKSVTFPQPKGWTLKGGTETNHDNFRINVITKFITMQKFDPPTSTEQEWQKRLTYTVDFTRVWAMNTFFLTPRDTVTWLKIQHRNLFTASRNDQTNGICRACGWTIENQLHLARCRIIKSHFWDRVIQLIKKVGGETPNAAAEHTEYILLGRVSDTKHADQTAVGILALAWRILYAETVSAHIDKHNVDSCRALKRLATMLKERLTAYGEKWKSWCDTRVHTTKQNTIPIKYQERGIISQDIFGHYTINPEIQKWHDAI